MQGLKIHFYLWAFERDMLMKLDDPKGIGQSK
jgi:hypothetical protein